MSTTEKTGRFPMKNRKQPALRIPLRKSLEQRDGAFPFGDMTLGIYTNKIEDNLSPQGGRLYLRYTLDVNASFLSDNEIYLEVVTQQEA